MKSYWVYFLKRLVLMLVTLWLIITATFFLMKLLPGSPFVNQDKLTPAQVGILNKQYGMDKPVTTQYIIYLKGFLTGDFGVSFQFKNQPVADLLKGRIGPSMQLGVQAVLFGTVIGIILGVLAATFQNTWIDSLATTVAILGRSIPNFVFAILLQYIVGLTLGLLPIAMWKGFSYTILPTIAL
ncbi:MAG: ABC transporter permease, partial [Clostridia bacterium]|nr:ABC transporter permease [Clostridia bacterium]